MLKKFVDSRLFDFCLTIFFIYKCRTNVIACAKHFVGDGGTELGLMEGNTVSSFEDLEEDPYETLPALFGSRSLHYYALLYQLEWD